jgi:hypothetical protein
MLFHLIAVLKRMRQGTIIMEDAGYSFMNKNKVILSE